MSILNREWTDFEKWSMGILAAIIIVIILGLYKYGTSGEVKLIIANDVDNFGRCLDRELFIINELSEDAEEIKISFDVDHFTRQGAIHIEYGDEREELITSVTKTLLPRKSYIPIEHGIDYEKSIIVIPRLRPQEYIHLYFGGESVIDIDVSRSRTRLLENQESDLMDKPRVVSAVRKNGIVEIQRIEKCNTE